MRVARLDTGMAAEDHPSRTRHVIGNLEAAPLENGEVEAKTAFLVYRSHWRRIISSSPAAARTCCPR
jgi:3-phenylpropionate/cinnamic acid dioxygenase small subunit